MAVDYDLGNLVQRLSPTVRSALRSASRAGQAAGRATDLADLLLALIQRRRCDLVRALGCLDVSMGEVEQGLRQAVTHDAGGVAGELAPALLRALEAAWLASSLRFPDRPVRSGMVLVGALSTRRTRDALAAASPALAALDPADLVEGYDELTAGSEEVETSTSNSTAGHGADQVESALDRYTVDLTARARAGAIDPVVGRESELRQLVDVLSRRRQNNPILVGEAGVGKTAVVEGFALLVAQREVPRHLEEVTVRSLDLALLQAGASLQGEFEARLRAVLDDVAASEGRVVLFVDEAHTLVGAGGRAGTGDAANLLKPALARGEVRMLAATTWAEYKEHVEPDPALVRRFQVVRVDEPDLDTAIAILRKVAQSLREHHGVAIDDEAVVEAVRLSARYVQGRQLPDKAVSILDTACARVRIAQDATPSAVETVVRRIDWLSTEREGLRDAPDREAAERRAQLAVAVAAAEEELEQAEFRWQEERKLVRRMRALREEMARGDRNAPGEGGQDGAGHLREKLVAMGVRLAEVQGEQRMIPDRVDVEAVAGVVSAFTGVPVGRMLADELELLLELPAALGERVVGQEPALATVARRLQTARAQLADPDKPQAVFLLVGPSGVGKTETAQALADLMYGGRDRVVTLAMSEYQEAHTVSGLKGAPPGYVGYGKGGVLTEAVRRNPHAVVLLDELEKAHEDVLELFYQVFDKGRLEDGQGVVVDFRNTLILATSNLGLTTIHDRCRRSRPEPEALVEAIRPELSAHLKPALLGRMTVVPYYPLRRDDLREILRIKIAKIQDRFADRTGASLDLAPGLLDRLANLCVEGEGGAREVDRLLEGSLLPELAVATLRRAARTRTEEVAAPTRCLVSLGDRGRFAFMFTPPLPDLAS